MAGLNSALFSDGFVGQFCLCIFAMAAVKLRNNCVASDGKSSTASSQAVFDVAQAASERNHQLVYCAGQL